MSRTVLLLVLLFSGCTDQLVLFIDTDAPIASQVDESSGRADPHLSADAAIDTLRVDVLRDENDLVDTCELRVPNLENWPVSFAIARPSSAGQYWLRVRGFRRLLTAQTVRLKPRAHCGKPLDGETVVELLEPPPEVTIDRLVQIPPVATGLRAHRLQLPLGCMGEPASFLTGTSCASVPPGQAARYLPLSSPELLEDLGSRSERPPTIAGSSALAREKDCTSPPPAGLIVGRDVECIRGGFQIQGDPFAQSTADESLQPRPMRAVHISPYYMDKYEFTVARMQKLVPGVPPPAPASSFLFETERDNCTWEQKLVPNSRWPLNCVGWDTALAACRHGFGTLPTEAQWEHAARGRGRGWRFAWGSQIPDSTGVQRCCKSAVQRIDWWSSSGLDSELLSRVNPPDDRCFEFRVAPVGSYDGKGCPDGGDISRDGVFDLTGNVAEYTLDDLLPYSARCGVTAGVSFDPLCRLDTAAAHGARGGWYSGGISKAHSGTRLLGAINTSIGFRCAYPGQ